MKKTTIPSLKSSSKENQFSGWSCPGQILISSHA